MLAELFDETEIDQDFDLTESPLSEVYFADGSVAEEDGLIWKEILREGEWAYRPGPGQKPVPVPLKVVRDNASTKQELGMKNLVEAFEDQAIDHVTVPTSHDDKPHENTGFVKKLRITERDGKARLEAGIEFTEPDIKAKAIRKSIANTSSGVIFDYIKKDTGKRYEQALGHVALTNKPWINGMEPFSEDYESEETTSLIFADDVWSSKKSFAWLRGEVEKALRPHNSEGSSCYVSDIMPNRALITKFNTQSGEQDSYVAGFQIRDDKVKLTGEDKWIRASKEWVKASEESNKDFKSLSDSLKESLESGEDTTKLQAIEGGNQGMAKEETKQEKASGKDTPSNDPAADVSLSEEARAEVEKNIRENLSEEFKKREEEKDAENKALKTKVHEMSVEKRVAQLSDDGFDKHPGLLKEIRDVLLADVDQSETITLSEEADGETKEVKLSVSGAVERIIGALPKEEGKLKLGEQHNETEDKDRPATKVDENLSEEERTKLALQDLGYEVPEDKGKEDETKKDGDA